MSYQTLSQSNVGLLCQLGNYKKLYVPGFHLVLFLAPDCRYDTLHENIWPLKYLGPTKTIPSRPSARALITHDKQNMSLPGAHTYNVMSVHSSHLTDKGHPGADQMLTSAFFNLVYIYFQCYLVNIYMLFIVNNNNIFGIAEDLINVIIF